MKRLLSACLLAGIMLLLIYPVRRAQGASNTDVSKKTLIALIDQDATDTVKIQNYIKENPLSVNHEKDAHHNSALHYAVDREDDRLSQILLDMGAIVDARNDEQRTPLFYAKNFETVNVLVRAGAKVNDRDIYDRNPFHYIADPKVAQTLLESLPSINKTRDEALITTLLNAPDKEKNSPLFYAPNTTIIQWLVDNGALTTLINAQGQTVLMYVLQAQSFDPKNSINLEDSALKKKQKIERTWEKTMMVQGQPADIWQTIYATKKNLALMHVANNAALPVHLDAGNPSHAHYIRYIEIADLNKENALHYAVRFMPEVDLLRQMLIAGRAEVAIDPKVIPLHNPRWQKNNQGLTPLELAPTLKMPAPTLDLVAQVFAQVQ